MLYNNFIDFVGQVRPFSNSYFANIMILLYIEAKTDNKKKLKSYKLTSFLSSKAG